MSDIVSLTFSYDNLENLRLEHKLYRDMARDMFNEIAAREDAYQSFREVASRAGVKSAEMEGAVLAMVEVLPKLVAAYEKAKAAGWDGKSHGYSSKDESFASDMRNFLENIIRSLEATKGSVTVTVSPEMAKVLYHPWGIPSAGYRMGGEVSSLNL